MGLRLFLERIVQAETHSILRHLITTLLQQIRIDREGYNINASSVKGCVQVLLSLATKDSITVYKLDFEPAFLGESAAFFKAEGLALAELLPVPEYLRRVRIICDSYSMVHLRRLRPASQARWSAQPS